MWTLIAAAHYGHQKHATMDFYYKIVVTNFRMVSESLKSPNIPKITVFINL